jgi:adenylate cyclase
VNTEEFKRKLTAILNADVKGYSRLMGEDEAETVRTLTSFREAMTTLIQEHRGRVVDSPGDNLLAEFASVVDAVQCAMEIQKDFKGLNAEMPDNRKMLFRIGINLGDVIEEGERIYGDGVNIAARLESLADGGGICISGSVYEQIKNKLIFNYEDIGEHSVKNISEPIRVYKIQIESEVPLKETETISAQIYDLELPDKPSIGVLPFTNMSGDPEQEYFSDGLTEDIITGLSKVPRLFVIARNSTFTYKGKPVIVQQVSRELGVKYALEGSVRKVGNRVRITAQLVDATTGNHLWAERYDRDLEDVFALQDEITMKILMALQVKLTEGEQARVLGIGTENHEAYVKILQGREHIYRMNKEGNTLARQSFEEAITLDPEYAVAYTYLAWTYMLELLADFSDSPEQSLAKAVELSQKALALDDTSADAHALLGSIYLVQGQWEDAVAEGERSVDLNPNSADNIGVLGMTLYSVDRAEEAIALFEKAIRLNPMPPDWLLENLASAYRMEGRYEEAIAELSNVLHRNPDYTAAWLNLVVIYSSLGREEDARAAAAEVLRLDPKFSLGRYAQSRPLKNQAIKDRLITDLRKAGLE